jgi:hypothetical protein
LLALRFGEIIVADAGAIIAHQPATAVAIALASTPRANLFSIAVFS